MDTTNLGYSYHLPKGGFLLKLRNALSQFSDLFSEFNKYIAPAYHHDRCERSVQMRLYSMHKREFVMVVIQFLVCLGLAIFIGLTGPPITLTTKLKATGLLHKHNLSDSDIAKGPFIMTSPAMSTYNQQLWLLAVIETEHVDDESLDKSFHISIALQGLTSEHKAVILLHPDRAHNRTHHLKCQNQLCQQVTMLHIGFLRYTHYIVTAKFYDLEHFHMHYTIKEINFYFKSYNPAFTQIEIWFRLIFLLTTFIIAFWFLHSLRLYTIYDWSIEQKWISILLPLLLLYNDPIFPMTFLVNSWIPSMLDSLFQATFLCSLLMFWLCMYHGIRQTERKFLIFYLPKIVIIGPLWFTSVVIATWQKINELRDPTYSYKVSTSNFYTFRIFFFIFIAIYLFYLLCLVLKAYTDLRSMPFFDLRLKFLTLLMLVVICISVSITIMRFGIGALEDNFVAELTTTYTNSSEFMSFYGLLNFYLYTMAYVYSPSKKAVLDTTSFTKDNPTFSMINDSDEDVIYGSEDESRRPLNRSHNEDDSD